MLSLVLGIAVDLLILKKLQLTYFDALNALILQLFVNIEIIAIIIQLQS